MQNEKWWTNLINEEDKPICCMCKKILEEGEEEHPVDVSDGWGSSLGACKECYEKKLKHDDLECWSYATVLIGSKEIHCIKCTTQLSEENITSTHTDSDRISLKCHQCKLEFTIYHGEPGDGDYHDDDYDEEKERERYYIDRYGEY